MSTDLAVWIGVAVAFLVGVIGWIFAGVADRRAKAANKEAAKSNLIAKEALDKADQANRIAEDANRLSEEANKLVERSVASQTEDWFVDWNAEWNEASMSVVLKNRGNRTALQASVIVVSEDGMYHVQTWPEGIAANIDVAVGVPQFRDKKDAHWAARNAERRGVAYVPKPYRPKLSIMIRWRTGEGFPRHKELTLTAS